MLVLFVAGCSDKEDNNGGNKGGGMPPAPSGSLDNRGGVQVISQNLTEFFTAFMKEFDALVRPPASSFFEWAVENEGIVEGIVEGNCAGKILSYNVDEDARNGSYTATVEYNDYSNHGGLYFGGGFGQAVSIISNTSSMTVEVTIKGTVKFNGNFKDELVFDNFMWKYYAEYDENGYTKETSHTAHTGGSVKIKGLDITDRYFNELRDAGRLY